MANPRTLQSTAERAEPLARERLTQPPPTFFGRSPAARRVQAQIHRAVRSEGPVLIVGPTGTGRLTVARIIHHFAGGEAPHVDVIRPRPGARLVGLGAFTYLADLEDLDLEEQARLPALAGGARVVVATRLDPRSAVGRRRLDRQVVAWACLGGRIEMPSLIERGEDLDGLAMQIVGRLPTRRPLGGLADEALDCLRSHDWPGQLDELELVLREAAARARSPQIELRDLPLRLRIRDADEVSAAEAREQHLGLQQAERLALRRALAYSRGNRRKAARVLGIGKTTLYRKLREHGLD